MCALNKGSTNLEGIGPAGPGSDARRQGKMRASEQRDRALAIIMSNADGGFEDKRHKNNARKWRSSISCEGGG